MSNEEQKYVWFPQPEPAILTLIRTGDRLQAPEPVVDEKTGVVTGQKLVDADPFTLLWTLYVYVFSKEISLNTKDKTDVLDWKTGHKRMMIARRVEVELNFHCKPGQWCKIRLEDWAAVNQFIDHPKWSIKEHPHNMQLMPLIAAWKNVRYDDPEVQTSVAEQVQAAVADMETQAASATDTEKVAEA